MDLFITPLDENGKPIKKVDEVKKEEAPTNKFPSSTQFPTETPSTPLFNAVPTEQQVFTTPTTTPTTPSMSNEHLVKAQVTYQTIFENANQAGYDFYEFYQSVIASIDNPQIYPMAFGLGSGMDKTVTKEKLVQQGDFYLNEINKNYQTFVGKGSEKKQEILNQKAQESDMLSAELAQMNKELVELQTKIQNNNNKLSAIDTKYGPMISEVERKILANDMAKNQLIGSIDKVKQGIIQNIK